VRWLAASKWSAVIFLQGNAEKKFRKQARGSIPASDRLISMFFLAVVTLVLAPVVRLMKRSVAEKGAHIGH
jgi:hypothetical protein